LHHIASYLICVERQFVIDGIGWRSSHIGIYDIVVVVPSAGIPIEEVRLDEEAVACQAPGNSTWDLNGEGELWQMLAEMFR